MPKKIIAETRLYPVIIHREGDMFGYFSPEFGGGGAATLQDVLRLAQEMMETEAAALTAAGEPTPEPSENIDAEGGQVAWLPVTTSNAAERIFITLPKTLLAQIDATTNNRSGFVAELVRERLGA